MLYKKYHRSYVKQFKRGVKFRYKEYSADVVEVEPYALTNFHSSRICVQSNNWILTVVESDGKLMKYNVIQKIS